MQSADPPAGAFIRSAVFGRVAQLVERRKWKHHTSFAFGGYVGMRHTRGSQVRLLPRPLDEGRGPWNGRTGLITSETWFDSRRSISVPTTRGGGWLTLEVLWHCPSVRCPPNCLAMDGADWGTPPSAHCLKVLGTIERVPTWSLGSNDPNTSLASRAPWVKRGSFSLDTRPQRGRIAVMTLPNEYQRT